MKNLSTGVKRILVVEDEPAIRDICRRVLTGEGFEVDVAVNGKVAQDMIGQKQYDLCLIDIRIPTMDGKELYQWLQEKHPQLVNRVILTTGDIMAAVTQSFPEQAGRLFLPKPFTPEELKTKIREALNKV